MRGRLFIFSGIDGAGKTTQIDRIADLCVSLGLRPVTVWARGGYTRGVNLAKTILRRGSRQRIVPPSGPSAQRTRAFANPLVRKLWLIIAIVDLIRVYAFGVRWQIARGRIVLCDRYLQDTLLDFQLNYPSENVEDWLLWRLLVWSSPLPNAQFLLLVPMEVSQQRSKEKNEPFPCSKEVLESRLDAYRRWAASPTHWTVVDGERPREEMLLTIVGEIRRSTPQFTVMVGTGIESASKGPSNSSLQSAGAVGLESSTAADSDIANHTTKGPDSKVVS